MNILFIHGNYPAQFRQMASALGKQGMHDVRFLTARADAEQSQVINPPVGERACALDNGYGAARGTCESFCKFKCFFCWDKTHLFNGSTALADIGDLAWLRTSFFDTRGILMNDQATNWAGRELNLHWGFGELRADRAIHPKDLQGFA